MKYLIVSCLIMLLLPIPGTRAQVQPFNQLSPNCCPNYKLAIVGPPRNVDFKLIIIVPPKDLDQAMVFNPYQQPNAISTTSKVFNPDSDQKGEQFFTLPPFPTGKSPESVVHFWN
jgi:hypothetical protein